MKKFFSLFFIFLAATYAFSDGEEIQANLDGAFSSLLENLSLIVPENTSALQTTPDAYIGKLFPSIPPHFSAGIAVSGTLIDTSLVTDSIQTLFSEIKTSLEENNAAVDLNLSLPSKLPLPTMSVRARIGGLFLPFDAGVFAVATKDVLKNIKITDMDFEFDYITFGADFRYAVFQGNILLPQVSLGAGYIFQKQNVSLGASKEISSEAEGTTVEGNLSTAVNLALKTNTLYLQAQISKKILVFTPFLGGRALVTKSDYGFDWNYTTVINGNEIDTASKSGSGEKSRNFDFKNIQPQIFGGFALTLPFFEAGFSLSWNPRTNYFTGAVSTSFKL